VNAETREKKIFKMFYSRSLSLSLPHLPKNPTQPIPTQPYPASIMEEA